jgi:N-acetylglucosamine malate deacetylase 1
MPKKFKSMNNNILVIAPHPDDEILGCGGTIKRFSSKDDKIYILIATRGKPEMYSEERIMNVRKEALKAHGILGVTETRFFNFPAPDLDLISLAEISEAISSIITEFEIDTLFLPHRGDIHHDHKAVFDAGLVASRPVNNCTVKRVYSYETLSETEWAAPFCNETFIPTHFINISDCFSYKIEAMKCYKSQLKEFPNSRSVKSIEALANFRGSTIGFSYAEAFMTIRVIES